MSYKILHGDCIEQMRTLPDQCVNTCVTSPPYFGLRDYGHDGQIGLEATPDAFVAKMVDVFREVRRVLRDDGTVWLNLGDSYAAARGGTHQPAETLAGGKGGKMDDGATVNRGRESGYNPTRNAGAIGLKHKDLIGIPWRVAFALQADGWYLRQDIIWHKPNPMPESVTDRCTKAHEYIFLLSKSERYYFDSEAMQEPASTSGSVQSFARPCRSARAFGKPSGSELHADRTHTSDTRNRRSVWTVTTKPYKGAHFATFPPDLIRPCILAGCQIGGTVLDPFGGSGTTAQVAIEEGREAILCELNADYIKLAHERLNGTQIKMLW
jgi:site-specific DNA-methyltransferase (adenine-specific)